jgi:V/A-type H+/Na+-transporting ATPase subunit A
MNEATIYYLSGPVLHARAHQPFSMREAVLVGPNRLLGEVVGIDQDKLIIQVYEDTGGLRPGDKLSGSGAPVSIALGPQLLGHIFDGLMRPLMQPGMVYIQPGMPSAAPGSYRFKPDVTPGQHLHGGQAIGCVEIAGKLTQRCLVPPHLSGEVAWIADAGEFPAEAMIARLRDAQGVEREISMQQWWPVRQPRPAAERLHVSQLLHTGQRVIDCLFPVAMGSKAAIPGGFGTGKTVLLETLARWAAADVIVYVGCGERGNEIAGVLDEFPKLEDPKTGRTLLDRMVIIANTSNMPVAAREVCIYSAVTVAEFYRDQGLRVALMADSTSRWAEALREVSGRLNELPGEGGYPAYLSTRLAEFYERAAAVRTLDGTNGAVTILGSVSPPSGDFSEPVTAQTRRYVRSFWALDARRAQARFYPAIDPLQSYSEDAANLADWWAEQGSPDWMQLRQRFLTLLEEQSRLERMVRIVGQDALPPRQQLLLVCAQLVNESFLRQNAYSPADRYASPQRESLMMQVLARFIDRAGQAVEQGLPVDDLKAMPLFRQIQRMGEDMPEADLPAYEQLLKQIDAAFTRLEQAHEG